jgi:hypothetical protein
MSDKELVKRLLYLHRVTRDYDQEYMTSADYADMPVTTKKAADRIEALTAKLAKAVSIEKRVTSFEDTTEELLECGCARCKAHLDLRALLAEIEGSNAP